MSFVTLDENDVPGAKLSKLPEHAKRWLECRNLKKTGPKAELVQRVKHALTLGTPIDVKIDGGSWYDAKVKSQPGSSTLTTDGKTPTTKTATTSTTSSDLKWTTFPSIDIPNSFNEGMVYHYLVEQADKMVISDDDPYEDAATAKPLKKGKMLFASCYVENVGNAEDEQNFHIQAHVHHSMKSELPLLVRASLSKRSSFVTKCSCTCVAKKIERCCHVAAVLYYLLHYVAENGHKVNLASTSLPCTWNKGKKRQKNPQPLHEAFYGTQKRNPGRLYNWDPRLPTHRGVNVDNMNTFVRSLQNLSAQKHNGAPSMWETLLTFKYNDFELCPEEKVTLDVLSEQFEANLKENVTRDCGPGDYVEVRDTQEQSQSEEWFRSRWPLVTASDSKSALSIGVKISLGKPPLSQIVTLVKKKLWEKAHVTTADMMYGIREEPVARKKYEELRNTTVLSCGLFVSKKFPYLGASPDGIIMEGQERVGIIEIKCFKIFRTKTIDDVIKEVTEGKSTLPHCLEISDGRLVLKRTHQYYYQIQHQLMITGTGTWFCDFVIHSPLCPPHVERIGPDVLVQKKIEKFVYVFWKKCYIPEYFLMKIPRGLDPYIQE